MADKSDVTNSIAKLQQRYDHLTSREDKDKLYQELLSKYEAAQRRIEELESEANKSKIPSKDEVEAMSGMLDLISKLDASTIEKLNKFGTNQ